MHDEILPKGTSQETFLAHTENEASTAERGKKHLSPYLCQNLAVGSFSPALWISRPGLPKSGSTYTSTDLLFCLPMGRQETASNTSNARPLRAKNRFCAMLDIFLSASYTPSSCSIFSIGGREWCRLNQKVVFHGLPAAIGQDGPATRPGSRQAAHDCAAVGPAFQNYHPSSVGPWLRLQSLLNKALLTRRATPLLFLSLLAGRTHTYHPCVEGGSKHSVSKTTAGMLQS